MDEPSLEHDLMQALRRTLDRSLDELAGEIDLPRTNFGRPVSARLRTVLTRLVSEGLVEEQDGRYRLAERDDA